MRRSGISSLVSQTTMVRKTTMGKPKPVYVVMFGVGSTLGMTLLTAIISAQLHSSHLRSAKWTRALRSFAATVTLSVGLFLMFKAGASAGLFTMI